MKRAVWCAVLALTAIFCASAYNYEIDINYYAHFFEKAKIVPPEDVEMNSSRSFLGLDANGLLPIGHFDDFYDFGININNGVDLFDAHDLKSGCNLFLSVAPYGRITFNRWNSFAFCPGLQLNNIFGHYYEAWYSGDKLNERKRPYFEISYAFSLNASYRFWFYNGDEMHVGLTIGCDVDFPFYGWVFTSYNKTTRKFDFEEYTTVSFDRAEARAFIGIAFNIGERPIDKKLGKTINANANSSAVPNDSAQDRTPIRHGN